MKSFWFLFRGEIVRLFKYKIIYFGILVSAIWVIILAITPKEEALSLMPTLLVFDTGMMSILLLAASYFYEKQEGTIKTLFVSPISTAQLLMAKVLSSLLSGLISMALIGLAMLFLHGVTSIDYPLAFFYVILSTFAHVSIGYLLIFNSVDFMGLLMKYAILDILLLLPTAFVSLGLIPESWLWTAFFSPSYCAQYLMNSLIAEPNTIDATSWWSSIAILLAISGTLFPIFIHPLFKREAIQRA